ncbi:hypothetical protein NXW11_24825 [Bacteroides thetaiotaomicron]|nr:hypothetical protein [Bacteroides thetaiotaomicron]
MPRSEDQYGECEGLIVADRLRSISGAYNGLITLGKGAKEVDGNWARLSCKVSETL